jgi:hypothetical protein
MYSLQDFYTVPYQHIHAVYMTFTDFQMTIIKHQTTRYPMQG